MRNIKNKFSVTWLLQILFNFNQRIQAVRVLGMSRNEIAVARKSEDSEKWRKCLQPGCTYRESMKNNNMNITIMK